jgi:hypothetical protein
MPKLSSDSGFELYLPVMLREKCTVKLKHYQKRISWNKVQGIFNSAENWTLAQRKIILSSKCFTQQITATASTRSLHKKKRCQPLTYPL